MDTFLFLFFTYIMGFFTAVPIGATQIEIAKRSLNNHLRAAYMVAAGSVSSDVMYGAIALFGVAPFMENKTVVAIFGLIATAILWVLAFFTFRDGTKANMLELTHATLKSKRLSFVTGFSLAVTNPMMIVWWLIGVKIVKDIGLISQFDVNASLLFLLAGGFGLAFLPADSCECPSLGQEFHFERDDEEGKLWIGGCPGTPVILFSYKFAAYPPNFAPLKLCPVRHSSCPIFCFDFVTGDSYISR